jgi:hypothetical protein
LKQQGARSNWILALGFGKGEAKTSVGADMLNEVSQPFEAHHSVTLAPFVHLRKPWTAFHVPIDRHSKSRAAHVKWSSTCRETAISSPSKRLQIGHLAFADAKMAGAVTGGLSRSDSGTGRKSAKERGGGPF